MDEVRFLLADTEADDVLLQDEEIAYALAKADNSVYQAAHDCAYAISAKFARKADTSKSVGDLSLSVSFGNRAREFRELGDSILELAIRREPPTPLVNPEALKPAHSRISTPTTDFYMGQFDNGGAR
jgi:hypothetical protein